MLDVIQFKAKKDGGWRAHRIGYAAKNDKGDLNVWLDSLPVPDGNGAVRIVVTQRQEQQQQTPQQHAPVPGGGPDFDDSIPFGPDK